MRVVGVERALSAGHAHSIGLPPHKRQTGQALPWTRAAGMVARQNRCKQGCTYPEQLAHHCRLQWKAIPLSVVS
eukprot:365661-Chlamydomonas_euryale.AAC.82